LIGKIEDLLQKLVWVLRKVLVEM